MTTAVNANGDRFRSMPQTLAAGAWPTAVVVLLLTAAVAVVFWQQIAGVAVFIGESDRLNSYLNIRLAEYDALKAFGRVPAWNSSMFGGFSMSALHWMNPGTDPIAPLLQLLPRGEVFVALGYVSISLVLAACVAAFFYIRDVTGAWGASWVGALAYGLSVFSLHRAAQVDNAELTVVLLPLGLLALRRVQPDRLVGPMIGLTALLTALAYWGFLQEVAYAYIFIGCYALYRAAVLKRGGQSPWAPLVVMATATIVALLFSAPRLITIQQEFLSLARSHSFQYYGYPQILRFFHEGIYGRYFEEGLLLGHSMNLHEGLQLVSSTALALFVCLGIMRPRTWVELVGAIGFFALFAAMLPSSSLLLRFARLVVPNPFPFPLSNVAGKIEVAVVLLLLLVFALWRVEPYLRIGAGLRRLLPVAPRPVDTSFHLYALVVTLAAILVHEGAYVVWRIFGRADFTHTRLSILAILPLCTLFAIYLAELKALPIRDDLRGGINVRLAVVFAASAGIVAFALNGPFLALVPRDLLRLHLLDSNQVMTSVMLTVLLTAALLGGVAVAVLVMRPATFDIRAAAAVIVGAFVAVEVLTSAHFKVDGPQTWTFPEPFRNFNYLNVAPSILRPPDPVKVKAFQKVMEADNYRMVVTGDDFRMRATNAPHVAAFWGGRTIGGYGTGVSRRLTILPWPKNTRSLRTIDFGSTNDLNTTVFPLLAFLNVKYLLVLTPDIYFDVATRGLSGEETKSFVTIAGRNYPIRTADAGGIPLHYIVNPVKPLPRQFMVRRVIGSKAPPAIADPLEPAKSTTDIHIFADQTDDLTQTSFVEGRFDGTSRSFDASGPLTVSYRGDVIDIRVAPSAQERFVVLTETYNRQWRVYIDGERSATIPTNIVMNGVLIPPGINHVLLRFEPFSMQPQAKIIMALAVLAFVVFVVMLWHFDLCIAIARRYFLAVR